MCLVVLAGLATTLAVIAHHFQPFLRAMLVQGLQDRFQTKVELDDFHVALGARVKGEGGIWTHGKGLRIWPPDRGRGERTLKISVQSIP